MQRGAGAARALVPQALLSLGIRRVRRFAGSGGRSLWRCLRRANRHCRHGAAQSPRFRRRCGGFCDAKSLLFKNDSAARELEGLPSYIEAAMGAIRRSGRRCGRTSLNSRRRWRRGPKDRLVFRSSRQPSGAAEVHAQGARVLDVFSYVGAWGVRAAQQRRARSAVCRQLRGGAGAGRGERRAQRRRDCRPPAAMRSMCSRLWQRRAPVSMSWSSIRRRSPSARKICPRRWLPTNA